MADIQTDIRHESPYWKWFPGAIALAGIIVFIFATFGPPASSSGFVSLLDGAIGAALPEYVANNPHYKMMGGPGSWVFAFVLGMAIGGFIAGRTSDIPVVDVPEIWKEKFGADRKKRYLVTFAGGFLILFASRLAGGCTLGLFISGSTQLAISGLYFGVVIFAFAMLTARLVYGGRVRSAGEAEAARKEAP
jgi:hypothetical protein